MSDVTDLRRKILVAIPNDDLRKQAVQFIESHLSNVQMYEATEGQDTLFKITNDPPNVVVVDELLPKLSGNAIIEKVFANKAFENVSVIFFGRIPDNEMFVDEVVIGRLQFVEDIKDHLRLSQALARCLNYAFRNRTHHEFYLKFLAPQDELIKMGEKALQVYILKRGQLVATIEKDQEVIKLGTIEPGEFVGEMAYINNEPRSANVTAVTDCELIEIPFDCLDHVLFTKPSWSKALMRTLSKRVKIGNQKAVK